MNGYNFTERVRKVLAMAPGIGDPGGEEDHDAADHRRECQYRLEDVEDVRHRETV